MFVGNIKGAKYLGAAPENATNFASGNGDADNECCDEFRRELLVDSINN